MPPTGTLTLLGGSQKTVPWDVNDSEVMERLEAEINTILAQKGTVMDPETGTKFDKMEDITSSEVVALRPFAGG